MPAAALYRSALFRKSLLAALDAADSVYILSAKHGVISCDEVIEPYDVTLKTMPKAERKAWGVRIEPQLDAVLKPRDKAILYCGEEYLAPLREYFERRKIEVEVPLFSLSLGARLQELTRRNEEDSLRHDGSHLAQLLRRLWLAQRGGRRLEEANGRLPWPNRGVYFILEADHGISGGRMPRVVRVGTHAVSRGSRTSMWDRLSTHRGTMSGSGSHRSSIFRLHVGRAWARHDPADDWPTSWAQGMTAPREIRESEQRLERQVSRIIGALRVIWLDVPDEPGPLSERAYFERNSIGMLSRLGLLRASGSPDWLGRYSADWRIATSGLWNLNHVFAKPDPAFLDHMAQAVSRTTGRAVASAPTSRQDESDNQMEFFTGGDDEWH